MFELISTLFQVPDSNLLVDGSYNGYLIALSLAIAIFASFMAFQVTSQAAKTTHSRRRCYSLITASAALGGGVWSMHFIGMLAFDLCTPVTYDWGLTLLSLIPSLGASWVALNLLIQPHIKRSQIMLGGVLVGAGIGTMHYVGMAAMEMAPLLRYDLTMFALSIVVAVLLAMLSLWFRFGLSSRFITSSPHLANLIAASVMGAAVSGMHYTGMAAARFVQPPGFEALTQSADISLFLAGGVSFATILIISLVLATNVIFSYKDMTERAEISESRIRAMMNTAVDGIITIDAQGKMINVNKAVQRILGWHRDELIGNNVTMLMPEHYHQVHDGFITRYLSTGQARIIGEGREVSAQHKDGHAVPVRLAIGHVHQDNQDYFVGFITDLTTRVKMERALKDNEARFRTLISNIPGIAYRALNQKGWPMVFISDAVEKITGYPASDFLLPDPVRYITDIVHPNDLYKLESTVESSASFSLEYRIVHRDGSIRWLFEHGTSVDDDNSGHWVDGYIMDITERKEMEHALSDAKEQAEQAAASRASFLANMSHEIRTPMNAIIGFSDIVLESELSETQKQQVTTINRSAKSLLHILNDVLDSAKLDKGKLELELRPFSVTQEVDAVISTLWLGAKQKGLKLTVNIEDALPGNYLGAPERIRQILTNLIGNAIKFTEQGEVSLVVYQNNSGRLAFDICDTGIGMTPGQVEKIFEAFAQADASMSRRFGGTGLGTTISKQLVDLMGGTIDIESEPGVGTCFKIALPLAHSSEPLPVTESIEVTLPPLVILVADDIQQNLDLLTIRLEKAGHRIITARNGQQALDSLKVNKVDVVLMDIQMPVMDGLTAARKWRNYEQQNALQPLPIIALTASVLEQDVKQANDAGMNGFAHKPVDFALLCSEIARVLGLAASSPKPHCTETQAHTIAVEKGSRLWGDEARYRHEVAKFIGNWPRYEKELSQAIEDDEIKTLKGLAHSLRGLCANLALPALQNLFAELETRAFFLSGEELKNRLHSALVQIVQIRSFSGEVIEPTSTQKHEHAFSSAEAMALLEQLEHSITLNELDDELCEKAKNALPCELHPDLLKIADELNDFEFERASEKLIKLKQRLAVQSEEV